jgi:hypothetical protein
MDVVRSELEDQCGKGMTSLRAIYTPTNLRLQIIAAGTEFESDNNPATGQAKTIKFGARKLSI